MAPAVVQPDTSARWTEKCSNSNGRDPDYYATGNPGRFSIAMECVHRVATRANDYRPYLVCRPSGMGGTRHFRKPQYSAAPEGVRSGRHSVFFPLSQTAVKLQALPSMASLLLSRSGQSQRLGASRSERDWQALQSSYGCQDTSSENVS